MITTAHPYVHAPHTQHPNNPSFSRFEVYPTAQTFCGQPDPLYSTQYSDLFVHTLMVSICIQDILLLTL